MQKVQRRVILGAITLFHREGLMFFDEYRYTNKTNQPTDPEVAQLWYCLSHRCGLQEWYVEADLVRRHTWLVAEADAATPHVISSDWPVCPHCTEALHKQS
jgi:hypothetical protein